MSFEKAFISEFLRIILSPRYLGIFPQLNWGKNIFHIGIRTDIRPKKTQSENHCKHFKGKLRKKKNLYIFPDV
jgi:hypothetical protein